MDFVKLFFSLILLSVYPIQNSYAEETDQFTLPPYDLVDIGPIASEKLYDVLEKVITQTNSEIASLSSQHSSQLASRLNGAYIADLIYSKTGPGFPRWLRWNLLPKELSPIQYREIWPWKTVYWFVFTQSPFSFIGLTPTVNLYGHYFGTDKLGHFFMQGHTYYQIYNYCLSHGKSPEQAQAIMVMYGQIIEQSYLGTLVNGVYSNADLSANYGGWKFYMNLTHKITIGHKTYPPILVLNKNRWEFSSSITKKDLLKPYLSDNLNEALNPSRYAFMRGQIRKQVEKRCPDWIARKGLTQAIAQAKLKETALWHGEPYGHWLPPRSAVTLNTCFGGR